MTETEIQKVLLQEMPGTSAPVLAREEALRRGSFVFEDMAAVGFPLAVQYWPIQLPGLQPFGVASYPIAGTPFTTEPAPDTPDIYKAMGPALSHGSFLKLSLVCSLARKHFRNLWPQQFATRLRNGADHLGVIEELLWLGRWVDVRHARKSYHQNVEGGNCDIDLRFKCTELIINLEAKYKWRDWMAKVDGPSFSRDFDSYFEDVDRKFVASAPGN